MWAEEFVMAVLYIDREELEIRAEGNHLCLYESGERRSTVPLNLLERVVIRGGAKLDAGVLATLADRDVGLLALGGRGGRKAALLLGSPRGDAERRIAQYRWRHDPAYRAVWSLALARLKLLSQKRLLLDPCVGFFHEPAHNRESLAADLIEPTRARVDEWVWRLFAERKLRGDAFSRQEDACLLGKAGRQTFYAEYEFFAQPLRRLLRRQALAVARRLLAERIDS
jgi:CRISPR/Cas system-associated endonuclease Cas1